MDDLDLRTLWSPLIPDLETEAADPGATVRPDAPTTSLGPDAGRLRTLALPTPPTGPADADRTLVAATTPEPAPGSSRFVLELEHEHDDHATPGAELVLIEEIGRGGMGVVYRARQGSLDREVAVKRLGEDATEATARRFTGEAIVTARLDHPNIVPVYDLAATPDGAPLLAMKLVGGQSWKALLHPGDAAERRDLDDHLAILDDVCHAIAFAHSRGVVHLDLKPENVMVGAFGEVLVMDWGLAARIDAAGADGAAGRGIREASAIAGPCGTPSYMPPELATGAGSAIGPRTDVSLLGAILHEILAGRPPHRGATLLDVIRAAAKSAPPELPASAPRELADVCRRALAADPADRFAGVVELQTTVAAFRRHAESASIADAAEASLARCPATVSATERDAAYALLSDAVSGFRQARTLWEENAAAAAGERRARERFAEAALALGDVGLAATHAAALGEPAHPLHGRVDRARTEAEREARAARHATTLRAVAVASLIAMVAGLGIGFLLINVARDDERRQRERAEGLLGDALEQAAHRAAEHKLWSRASVLFAAALAQEETPDRRHRALETTARAWAVTGELDLGPGDDLELSPDGRWLAVVPADEETSVRIVDAGTGEPISTVGPGAFEAAFSPGGDRIALVYGDIAVFALDADGRSTPLARFDVTGYRESAYDVAWSPDGRFVVACADASIEVFEVETGRKIEMPEGSYGDLQFLPDGRLAAGTSGSVVVYDVGKREEVRRLDLESSVIAPAFDGQIASAMRDAITVWLPRPGYHAGSTIARIDRIGADVRDLAWSPDAQRLAAACDDGRVRIYDPRALPVSRHVATLDVVADVPVDGAPPAVRDRPDVVAVAWAPEGLLALTEDGRLRTFRRLVGAPLVELPGAPERMRVRSLAVAPAGDRLAISCAPSYSGTDDALDPVVTIRDLETGSVSATVADERELEALAWSPDGERLAFGNDFGGELRIIDAAGSPVLTIDVGDKQGSRPGSLVNQRVQAVAWSPDGARIVIATDSGALQLRDAATGEPLPGIPDTAAIEGADFVGETVAWSRDGRQIVAGNGWGGVRVFDGASIECTARTGRSAEEAREGVAAIAISPDGRRIATAHRPFYASAPLEAPLRLWDGSTARLTGALARDHGLALDAIQWSPDGAFLAAAGRDGSIHLWDGEGRTRLARVKLHGAIGSIGWTPDGRLVGATGDRVQLWDLDALLEPAEALLERAQSRACLRLDGITLAPVAPPARGLERPEPR